MDIYLYLLLSDTHSHLDDTILKYVNIDLKNDKEFMLACIQQNKQAFVHANNNLKNDKKFILECVKINRLVLEYTDINLKNDKEIIDTIDWYEKLNKLKLFIATNHNRPTNTTNEELYKWTTKQKKCYTQKYGIMKYNYIYQAWFTFIENNKNLYK